MNTPKISIIVPCYGVEKYLDRCMESLVNQTLRDIEIILVDDVSPDRVPEMCDDWAEKDSRIKVIHKEKNEGLGYARNTGIEAASGEYVAFVDSDDFVERNMFEVLYHYSANDSLDACFCGFSHYSGNVIKDKVSEVEKYTIFEGEAVKEVALKGMLTSNDSYRIVDYEMSVWHALYKMDIIRKNNISFVSERELISEDIIFHIDYLPSCRKIGFIPDILYNYCLNPVSLSKVYKKDRFNKEIDLFKDILNRVKNYNLGWSDKDINKYFAFKERYVMTQCISFLPQLGYKFVCSELKSYADSIELKKWVYPYMNQYPKRYYFFYWMVKLHLFRFLIILVYKKS